MAKANPTGEDAVATPPDDKVLISPAELEALMKDRAELERLRSIGATEDDEKKNRRPMFRDPATGEWRQLDLEEESKQIARASGKRLLEETVDPKTGRVTPVEKIREHEKFVQRDMADRQRAEAMARAFTSGVAAPAPAAK